ncbi:MAG TPA: hypothetical protein VFW33_07420 [Gemmataceae bacterium]|nr:hypothetical protein [Gemmataceae bacterium]
MRWRLVICLAVLGIGLMLWGGMEWWLGRGASSTPERISLAQLIARGPEGNPNIILTDFELGSNFVYEEKNGSWNGVYVPAVPAGQANPAAGPGRPAEQIKAVIFSLNVHSDPEIGTVLGKRELPALVTNRIRSLGSEEKRLLQQTYGGAIDVDHCLIIQEGRKPMSNLLLSLMFGGGLLLLAGSVGTVAITFLGDRKRTAPRRKSRRDDDDDDRPRRRRRDEDDEDDEPRPKRRRPRDEDEP